MLRERALKIVLVLFALLFLGGVYPLVLLVKQEPAIAMMMSIYVTLGIFLLAAARNPAAHPSLIAFTAWSSLAHAGVMAFQAWLHVIALTELIGVALFSVIGVVLLVLPVRSNSARRPSYRTSTARA